MKRQDINGHISPRQCFKRRTAARLFAAVITAATLLPALTATEAHAQTANRIDINDNWIMQESSVLLDEGRREGWLEENSAGQTQEGRVLSATTYQPDGWYKATVPGTVLTTLVDNGVYAEPLYGENNRPEKNPESLCHTDWWYRTVVDIPQSYAGKNIWLNFDGINYSADVWVNGRRVGPIKGAFIRGTFDITPYVKAGEKAAIAVCISPQPHTGTPSEHTMGTVGGPCGGVGRLDGPTFGCSNGWDWLSGIRDRNSGLWQGVHLSATGGVVVKDPLITTDLPLPRTDEAAVTVQAAIQNITDKPQEGVLKGSFGDTHFEKRVTLQPYSTSTICFSPDEYPQLTVKHPKLWWPNGLGEPSLYTLHLAFEQQGAVSDARDVNFGIREITYSVPGSANLALSVNGVRVFCKGGNWGMDEALKRIPRERLEAQIRLNRQANFNMLRNWGGQSTSDDFYDLCDKYGMLVWDEFFQFNNADPIDHDLYMANVRDKVLRTRNHPSIAVWCGRNEAYPPKYLDDAVRFLLAEIDPSRHYQPNSGGGLGCNSGGPYEWQYPVDYYCFDEKKNFNKNETFKTEIGAMSVPTLESILGMMPEQDWDGITDAWAEHNFTSAGGRNLLKTMTKRYGKVANVADFVRKAQMMNYEGHRAMYEGRMGQMFTPVQGILLWMSVAAQPSFVWQIFHYDLEPNASFFALRKACEQVHIQLNERSGGTVQVVNHLPSPVNAAKACIAIYNLDGSVALEKEYAVNAAPCAVTSLGAVEWPEDVSDVHFVKAELKDSEGRLLSDNFYWRSRQKEPADLSALASMQTVKLSAKAAYKCDDGKMEMQVTLRNPGKSIALMAHLQLHRAKSGKRVLPVYYSDNYVSLAPGESKTITIEAVEKDLEGEQPLVLVDGWNVKVGKSKYVADNTNADIKKWGDGGFAFKPQPLTPQKEVRINCGGYNRGLFKKDPGFLEGSVGYYTESVSTQGVANPGPELMYRTVRWGECSYPCLMDGTSGQTYKVRLHFAELDKNTTEGKRIFSVNVNGKPVVTDLDVYKEAGGGFKALVKEASGIKADSNNMITITLPKARKGAPQICGFEILPQ